MNDNQLDPRDTTNLTNSHGPSLPYADGSAEQTPRLGGFDNADLDSLRAERERTAEAAAAAHYASCPLPFSDCAECQSFFTSHRRQFLTSATLTFYEGDPPKLPAIFKSEGMRAVEAIMADAEATILLVNRLAPEILGQLARQQRIDAKGSR